MTKIAYLGLTVSMIMSACKTTEGSLSSNQKQSTRNIPSFLGLNDPTPSGPADLTMIDGRGYPRIFVTSYRASNSQQLPLSKMLRGMFDDPHTPIESKVFTAMKFALAGKPIPFQVSDETTSLVASLTATNKASFTLEQEEDIIAYLLDVSFEHLRDLDPATLRNKYIYYQSASYEDFSDNLIYTTALPYIASFYGPRLVEINEWDSAFNQGAPRSADMNYLNYRQYGRWLEDGLPARFSFYWEDSEQLITPILTDGSAVTGYQIRDRFTFVDRTVQNSWNIFELIDKKLIGEFRSVNQPYSPIDFGFYKLKYQGETIIGVFSGKKQDGKDSTCMVRKLAWGRGWQQPLQEQIPHHCIETKPWEEAVMSNEPAALIGVIQLCTNQCEIPNGFLASFTTRRETLPAAMVREINATTVLDDLGRKRRGSLRYLALPTGTP